MDRHGSDRQLKLVCYIKNKMAVLPPFFISVVRLFQRIVTPRTRGAQFLRMQKLAPQG